MSKNKDMSLKSNNIKNYIIGLIIGVATTIIFMMVFAAVMLFAQLDRALAAPLATVCVALGALISAFYTAYKTGDKGYRTGSIIALIYFVAVTLISLLINGDGFTVNSVFHLVIILLSGFIGGILGVNRRVNKKYI